MPLCFFYFTQNLHFYLASWICASSSFSLFSRNCHLFLFCLLPLVYQHSSFFPLGFHSVLCLGTRPHVLLSPPDKKKFMQPVQVLPCLKIFSSLFISVFCLILPPPPVQILCYSLINYYLCSLVVCCFETIWSRQSP